MKSISPLYKISLRFSLKGGGWDEQRQPKTQPFAEIVRVVCAKCRRECDLACSRATLCGDRACRVREMQARVRFGPCPRNPLRRSCAPSARNAGESAIWPVPAQPSAEIVRVECAPECDLSGVRATLCGDRACRVREMQARVRFGPCPRNPLRRSCASSARNAGGSAIWPVPAQPSAEIVRVEGAKCRRECESTGARATLCGDHARRVREIQARMRLVLRAENPLRRSCVSSARNAGESAIWPVPTQPSAEIVRVECAKCRRECDLSCARATPCGDRACRVREMQARPVPAQPSAEAMRVECAKYRRECDWFCARRTLCGDRACRVREMQARVRFGPCPRNPLRRSCVSSARMQARVRFVLCPRNPLRRSCVSSARMQARVRFGRCPCNPLRRSCVSSARNTGENAILPRRTLCGDRACRVREM